MAYVWAKHEDVDRNTYQVLKGRGKGRNSPLPLVGGGSVAVPDPTLGLYPGPTR